MTKNLKLIALLMLMLLPLSLHAGISEKPSFDNLVKIQLTCISSPGPSLPISITNKPSRMPSLNSCPVNLYCNLSGNTLVFSSEGVAFTYTLLNDDEVISSGQSFGQENFTVSVPTIAEGSLTIRIEVGSLIYEGNIDM
ncbi:hypothetical protein [Prevotella lacticifex]|uniref:Uncharacterized protein n=1 Tax=Prevotella lacticifex TaxID=2854755 RepID=A0A9R1C958_9BACT|nr:hypothetical protein [Prevotella lacticifex]GJG35050.1 hypothetical protein PRLR5003_02070 [Prevotella lacticifex]GJG39899.1 hypothetical protein PRLR5019_18700 [Prevotella lacticifex]GJG41419.1 hypothetical protein PRLR5025_02050 [Prevotella lacticifex]GJG46253.1 hypothetical protein PRLR5027_18480 [Prevotella lacticifex]GJG47771.1 hypothetical protein PRLR5052_01840 [Prevotella lacticifex]